MHARTVTVCHPQEKPAFYQLELWTIVIFTIDYAIRVLTVHAVPREYVCVCV